MQQGTIIAPLSRSAVEIVDDGPLRELVGQLSEATAAGRNWKVRKKTLLDFLAILHASFIAKQASGIHANDETAVDAKDQDEDESDPDELFLAVAPMFMAAVLETLAEPRITCVEQAAMYLLSAHPEHVEAGEDWLSADWKRARAFKKFARANPYYRHVLSDMLALSVEEAE